MVTSKRPPIESSLYDEHYFLSECNGYQIFDQVDVLPKRISAALHSVKLTAGQVVLDVGCGRGELIRYSRQMGCEAYGIDYSASALQLASDYWKRNIHNVASVPFLAANARYIPFRNQSIDVVFILDVVEHLHDWELVTLMEEVYRVLKSGGRLVVHTAPNLWYYRWGYPLYRILRQLRGQYLPPNPRTRYAYHERVHINEQSIFSLQRILRRAAFKSYVWVDQVEIPPNTDLESPILQLLYRVVTRFWPLKLIFCGDVFAVGMKL